MVLILNLIFYYFHCHSNFYFIYFVINADIPLPLSWQIPRPCTVHHLVTHYLDINAIPRRYFFELLAFFAQDELQRDKFREFASAEGQVCMNAHSGHEQTFPGNQGLYSLTMSRNNSLCIASVLHAFAWVFFFCMLLAHALSMSHFLEWWPHSRVPHEIVSHL